MACHNQATCIFELSKLVKFGQSHNFDWLVDRFVWFVTELNINVKIGSDAWGHMPSVPLNPPLLIVGFVAYVDSAAKRCSCTS